MNDINTEIWKETGILGTLVSNMGRVKRKDGFIYKLQVNKSNGYNYVNLSINNKTIAYKVARLVAIAFIPNPENKRCVDHIDTNKLNDVVSNLRWVTHEENMANPITKIHAKASKPKERPWNKKPILQYTKDGEFIKEWPSATDFGKTINKDVCGNIIACIKGKQPTAYGYKWKYKEYFIYGASLC